MKIGVEEGEKMSIGGTKVIRDVYNADSKRTLELIIFGTRI